MTYSLHCVAQTDTKQTYFNKNFVKILPTFLLMIFIMTYMYNGFPGGSDSKESACNAGDLGSIPGSGRLPSGRRGNPLQYSCLENPMNRGSWQATVHGIANSCT